MSNNTFTIRVKCGEFNWQGASLLHGFSMLVDDFNPSTATQVPELGMLVSGNPPKWFRGFCSYTDTAGWIVLTDRSEGSLATANYFQVSIDGGTAYSVGDDGVVNIEGDPFAATYYAEAISVHAPSQIGAELKTHYTNGTTAEIKITVIDDSAFDTATDVEGSMVREATQPLGFDRGLQVYSDIIR
ncbi:hypothetical protein OAT94_01620 [Schleiferiaceae bacterium]|nr:hypothetical protein [Schleiferiaceae bacterium]